MNSPWVYSGGRYSKCLGEYTCKVSACVSENKSIERVSSWLTECVSDGGFELVDVHMSDLGGDRY